MVHKDYFCTTLCFVSNSLGCCDSCIYHLFALSTGSGKKLKTRKKKKKGHLKSIRNIKHIGINLTKYTLVQTLKTTKHCLEKSKIIVNGEIYHVYGLEEFILLVFQFSQNWPIQLKSNHIPTKFIYRISQVNSKMQRNKNIQINLEKKNEMGRLTLPYWRLSIKLHNGNNVILAKGSTNRSMEHNGHPRNRPALIWSFNFRCQSNPVVERKFVFNKWCWDN